MTSPVVLPNSLIKIWGKSVQGFLSYNQTDKDYYFIKDYLGNPAFNSGVKGSPTDYPPFVVSYDFNYFSRQKSIHWNSAKNTAVDLPSSPIKIRGKSVQGFLSYYRKNKQRNRDYTFIYILFIIGIQRLRKF